MKLNRYGNAQVNWWVLAGQEFLHWTALPGGVQYGCRLYRTTAECIIEALRDWAFSGGISRLLGKGTYVYEGSNSQDIQQLKRQTITEPEFQLADDMLPLSHIIGGPNGQKKLLDVYESERFRWAVFKVNSRPTDYTKRDAVDKYDRMLAYFAPIVDARLEALWAVVLIRGQYHRVCRYIGFMDVESSSEILLKAKENLRLSVMRSLDDTEDIYPVYFSPASWAQYRSTSSLWAGQLSNLWE
ncbi:uncharacterized protein N7500_004072 [Penicillium coprophilum]|uniref:uncharacterized protein n=1 Tax=Penicillium coprophilum TaxID=36646 RepID=UPI0023A48EC4|nr:uncharacterized protein N7500_004072 [Penicillium coprophilum]KAJ5171289.1 hypothetical protein N7500_004072 [Penicillium coprophilum]